MIVTLYCFIFTAIIFTVIGKGLLFAYYKSAIKHYTLVDTYFIGLCLSGALLNIWSIFLPTDFISFLFLALLTLVLIGFNRFYYFSLLKKLLLKIKAEKILSLLLLGCLIITLLFAIVKPKLFDTYLYHINAIQWNEYYRAVPGLANLHDRFGFNSSMFVLSAGFSYSAIYNQYIFIISSLTFLMFFVWCVKKAYQKKGVVGLFLLLFIYYFISQYFLDISSPGTDLLPNILVSYLLLNLVVEGENFDDKYLLFIVLSFFCLTLKLSMFPIVFLGLITLYHRYKNYRLSHTKLLLLVCF